MLTDHHFQAAIIAEHKHQLREASNVHHSREAPHRRVDPIRWVPNRRWRPILAFRWSLAR